MTNVNWQSSIMLWNSEARMEDARSVLVVPVQSLDEGGGQRWSPLLSHSVVKQQLYQPPLLWFFFTEVLNLRRPIKRMEWAIYDTRTTPAGVEIKEEGDWPETLTDAHSMAIPGRPYSDRLAAEPSLFDLHLRSDFLLWSGNIDERRKIFGRNSVDDRMHA